MAPNLQRPQQAGSLRVEDTALIVEDASYTHAGNYTCVVSNLAGNSSVSLQLTVTRKSWGSGEGAPWGRPGNLAMERGASALYCIVQDGATVMARGVAMKDMVWVLIDWQAWLLILY